jgi:serine/threonine protein kinase
MGAHVIGQIVGNRYKILQQLGTGGMAWSYLAEDTSGGAQVVVKVLFPQFAEDVAYAQRFIREAKSAMRLSDPRIVKVLDYGSHRETRYLVMEYVQGRDVKNLLQARGPLPVAQVLDVADQTAQALEYANERGIVYRDIKPQNLMITPSGMVKLLDLGMAQADALPSLTQSSFIGSLYYISPEQAMGARTDLRSSIYSLGIVMYEMLAGTPPFVANTPWMIVNMHLSGSFVPLTQHRPDAPEGVEWLVKKAMAKDPRERFQTIAELREAIGWVAQESSTPGSRGQPPAEASVQRPGPASGQATSAPGSPARSAGRRAGTRTTPDRGRRDATEPPAEPAATVDDAESRRRQERVIVLYGQGLRHYGAREWREARTLFEEVAKLAPRYRDTDTLLAVTEVHLAEEGAGQATLP